METVDFLPSGLKILQDTRYYRFTSDAVLLSKFLKAKRGEVVADFCSGSGIVGLHFFAENTGVKSVTLFEMQEELSSLSARSVALNRLEQTFTVENCRLQEIPKQYTEAFSLILCNPPYEQDGFDNADPKKALCRKELSLTLSELCKAAKKCLKYGGRFALIHRADRLAELMYTLHENGLEPKKVQFVSGRKDSAPYAVLLSAVKGGKAGVEILPTRFNQREEV